MKRSTQHGGARLERLHVRPRRYPRFERLDFAAAWPTNATGEHRNDPLWQELLRTAGPDAVRLRIEQQLADQRR
jgi:hypothetical protein